MTIEDRLAKLEAAVFPEKVAPRLVSLVDWNNQRLEDRRKWDATGPRRNGIACPKCGAELFDSNPFVTLGGQPPQVNIHCEECKYTGYRYQ